MSTPAAKDRMRAARYREKKKNNKLKPAELAWLTEYERSSVRSTIRAAKRIVAPTVRGPQLAIGGTSTRPSGSHQTKPAAGRVDASQFMWTPVVPPTPEGAEPPVEGMPKPPPAGTPLVDGIPAQGAPGTGDPAAAQQLAAFVMFFVHLGIRSGRELAADMDIPPDLLALLNSEELSSQSIGTVGQATERLAMKYGLRAIPLADEIIVSVALVGSGFLVVNNVKRKKLKQAKPPAPTTEPASTEKDAPPQQANDEPFPKSEMNNLWRESQRRRS